MERPIKADFVVVKNTVEILWYCQTLDEYIQQRVYAVDHDANYIYKLNRKGIEDMHILEITGCGGTDDNVYKMREYGAVLQAWIQSSNTEQKFSMLKWPIGIDFASEMGEPHGEYDICAHWKISNAENEPTNFNLESQQQGNKSVQFRLHKLRLNF